MSSLRTSTKGSLRARPSAPRQHGPGTDPGLHALELSSGVRDGRLFLPRSTSAQPRPLMVALHGAGGDASSMLHLIGKSAAAHECVLLALDARKHTWDFLLDDFGPDVTFLDRALAHTFDLCQVDPTRIALAGFSVERRMHFTLVLPTAICSRTCWRFRLDSCDRLC